MWLNGIDDLPYLEIAGRMKHVAAFEFDDGYFGYLSRYWAKLAETFGRIDPWDTVAFHGAGLEALINCLAEARADAASLPEAWSVLVGIRMSNPAEAVYEPVQKHVLLERVDRLLEAAEAAQLSGRQLLFFGD